MFTLKIGIYVNSVPYTPDTILLKTSLGGSESAQVYMARELVKLGHRVVVYTRMEAKYRGEYDGVTYLPWEYLERHDEFDVFIALRYTEILKYPIITQLKVAWFQDMLIYKNAVLETLFDVEEIFLVSKWQHAHYLDQAPELSDASVFIAYNGIHLPTIEEALHNVAKVPNRLIHISRPERGLGALIPIFKQMRQSRPELELFVARYYSMYEPQMTADLEYFDSLVQQTENCHFLGHLNKQQLYQQIAQAKLMVYPNFDPYFRETFCIAAIESQACGTPIVCSNVGALQETVGTPSTKIEGDYNDGTYTEQFISKVFELLDNQEYYEDIQQQGKQYVEKFDYRLLARQWTEHFEEVFHERRLNRTNDVYRALTYRSDWLAAYRLAQDSKQTEWLAQCNEKIQSLSLIDATILYFELTQSHLELYESFIRQENRQAVVIIGNRISQHAISLALRNPQIQVAGIDFDITSIDTARSYVQKHLVTNIRFMSCALKDASSIQLDWSPDYIIVHGSLDGMVDYVEFINNLEAALMTKGRMLFMVPAGPSADVKTTIHYFSESDLLKIFGSKDNCQIKFIDLDYNARGDVIGNRIVTYLVEPGRRTGERDLDKAITVIRPYRSIAACIITFNNAHDISRCLNSIKEIVDHIYVTDSGSTDKTLSIIEQYPNVTIRRTDPLDVETGFERLRNESIRGVSENWILWLDPDEYLLGANQLRKYCGDSIYNAYHIGQHNFSIDIDKGLLSVEWPPRLYRNHRGYQFWGLIHEFPAPGLNDEIAPRLAVRDVHIAHLGYMDSAIRSQKVIERNMHLVSADRLKYPDRDIGPYYETREVFNAAMYLYHSGKVTDAQTAFELIIRLYDKYFPAGREEHFEECFYFFQEALRRLDIPSQTVGVALDAMTDSSNKMPTRTILIREKCL